MNEKTRAEEESILRRTVRDLAERQLAPRAAELDRTEAFPWDNVRAISELGLFGLTLDPEFGGAGGTALALAIATEELSRGCAATGTVYAAHALCASYISRFGTEDQKSRWLGDLAEGKRIGAFALTEPGAGSDAAAITTTVSNTEDGFSLSGTKCFITNAAEAWVFVVMATRDRTLGHAGIETFIVEGNTPGLSITPQHGKLGIRASSTSEVVLSDVRVPTCNRIGGEGEGFSMTMRVLDVSRIAIAAQAVGIAQAALDASVTYARQRHTFGRPIADRQAVRWMIADSATQVEAARLLTYRAAGLLDAGEPFEKEASMAKLAASRAAVECADRAVQIHGGVGYFAPTTVERLYRDAKITEIYEGTSEIQRTLISRRILDR